jgi:hypothetical protein
LAACPSWPNLSLSGQSHPWDMQLEQHIFLIREMIGLPDLLAVAYFLGLKNIHPVDY